MKKIFLSLTLLSSMPLMPSAAGTQPAPEPVSEPVVQDKAVIEAVNYAETNQYPEKTKTVLPHIIALNKNLEPYISSQNRDLIIQALVYLAQTGELTKSNFEQKAKSIVAEMIKRQFEHRVSNYFHDPILANKCGSSEGRNALTDIKNKGLSGSILAPYFDQQGDRRFTYEANKSAYNQYRRW